MLCQIAFQRFKEGFSFWLAEFKLRAVIENAEHTVYALNVLQIYKITAVAAGKLVFRQLLLDLRKARILAVIAAESVENYPMSAYFNITDILLRKTDIAGLGVQNYIRGGDERHSFDSARKNS